MNFISFFIEREELVTAAQARKTLTEYIAEKNLTLEKDKAKITLDELLSSLHKDWNEGDIVDKREVTEKLVFFSFLFCCYSF